MRLLIIEDDVLIQKYLSQKLKEAGYLCDCASTASQALELVYENPYDLILLDILLPEGDGFSICASLRRTYYTPIIFMSCLDDTDSIVKAFDLGGDDYLVKPFEVEVLIARVRANIRRAEILNNGNGTDHYSFSDFTLDCGEHCVVRGNSHIPLTALEYQVLRYFVTHPDTYHSADQVYQAVWGHDSFGDVRTVSVHICSLRKKIEPDPAKPKYLQRHRGFGYIFVSEEQHS